LFHFPRLQTGRLNVQLRELTIRQSVRLAATPLERHEAATTALLACIVEDAAGEHSTPGRWTVQERMFVVAHYLACVADEGGNFAVGDGRFMDYLRGELDAAPNEVDAGTACGDTWRVKQLTGDEAVAVEALCADRLGWTAADMAARMRAQDGADPAPPDATDKPADYAAWLVDRKAAMEAMPDSDFEALFDAYRRGLDALKHLFWLEFDERGHVVMPKRKEGGADLAPARFPVTAALGPLARVLGA
jgi:hypothetical protein